MSSFDLYAGMADAAVDDMFGEAIQFQPRRKGGYMSAGEEDASRIPRDAIGYVVSTAVQLGSNMRTPGGQTGGGSFVSRRGEADLLLKVQDTYLTDVVEGDWVLFKDGARNGLVCEISYRDPGSNGRSTLHLMRNDKT